MKHPILNMKSSEFPASIVDATRSRKSPAYLYCAAKPVMFTDPTGLSTRVVDNGNGTYEVIGGALDGDLRIFETMTIRL